MASRQKEPVAQSSRAMGMLTGWVHTKSTMLASQNQKWLKIWVMAKRMTDADAFSVPM